METNRHNEHWHQATLTAKKNVARQEKLSRNFRIGIFNKRNDKIIIQHLLNIRKKHNDASIFHPYTSDFSPYDKENNHTMESYMPIEVIANAKNLSNSVDAAVSLSGGLLLFCILL